MGTQIQSEIYLLGHCSKRDVNVHMSSGTWPLYGEENALKNGQNHDSSMAWRALTGGYLGHDKEKVRETMMKHESIFRHQVQELHRLYRRQSDLMYEIKMKELHNHQKKTEGSQSGLVSSYISSEDAKRTWHDSQFSSSNSMLGQFPPPGASDKRSPATVMEGKSLLGSFASQEMRHLEKRESQKSYLADLDEHIPLVETSLSCSLKSSGNMFFLTENSSFGSQHHMTGMDGKTGLNNLLLNNGRTGKDQITYGFKTGICSGDSRTDFKSSHVERKTEHQSKHRIFGVEIFEEDEPSLVSSGITHSNHKSNELQTYFSSVPSWRTAPSYSGKKLISHINHGATSSESSCWKSDSILQNLKFGGGAVLDNSDTRKFSSSKNEVPYRNGFCVNLQLDSKSVTASSSTGFNFLNGKNAVNVVPDQFALHDSTKCWKGVDSTDRRAAKLLKSDSETANMCRDASVLKHDPSSASSQSKALPWFMIKPQQYNDEKARARENSSGMNLDSLQCSQHFLKKTEIAENFFQNVNLKQEPNLSTTTEDAPGRRVDCINGKKIFGFRIPEVVSETDDIDPTGFGSEAASCSDGTKFPNQLEAKPNVPEKGLNNFNSGLRHHIDLNLSMNDEESPSAPALPAAVLKIAMTEIDLEVPAVLESEVSASEADHRDTTVSLDESSGTRQDLIRLAAEAIVSISSAPVIDVTNCSTCQPLEATSPDCLKWFAEVISSYDSDEESKVREFSVGVNGSNDEESVLDGMDYFEFMTLKLEDVKEHRHCYNLPNIDNQDDEEPVVTTMPKRPRRVRGRHTKDFQRDYLPSLVSLSKQEVVEDLQTIESLCIASGCNWQPSLSHRNGRGRRRTGDSLPSSLKNSNFPRAEKPICRELGVGDKSLPGWGKRTRRLPRRRNLKK